MRSRQNVYGHVHVFVEMVAFGRKILSFGDSRVGWLIWGFPGRGGGLRIIRSMLKFYSKMLVCV